MCVTAGACLEVKGLHCFIEGPDTSEGDIQVAHRQFRELGALGVRRLCKKTHVVYDIKHVFPAAAVDGRL